MRCLIKTDGTRQDFDAPQSIAQILTLIGARTLDIVALRHMGRSPLHVMAVDDNGYETRTEQVENVMHVIPTRARKPVNAEATKLYHANCVPGTTHEIVGDVFISPDDDFA